MSLKEIGGSFWTEKNLERNEHNLSEAYWLKQYKDFCLLSTGRNCISFVIDDIKKNGIDFKTVFLPAFTCESVIKPFADNGIFIYFYDITNDLQIDFLNFKTNFEKYKPNVVLFHRYFGFESVNDKLKDYFSKIKENGTIIIEDITHSFFSNLQHIPVDYYIGSLRKWLGVIDGAIAISCNNEFSHNLLFSNHLLEQKCFKAMNLKRDFIFESIGTKENYLNLFSEVNDIVDASNKIYSISPNSLYVLFRAPFSKFSKQRVNNYLFLKEKIKKFNFLELIDLKMNSGIVPLYFVCYAKNNNRDYIKKIMKKNSIYLPNLWMKARFLPSQIGKYSEKAYKDLLVFPIDQRYDISDMDLIVKVLSKLEYNGKD